MNFVTKNLIDELIDLIDLKLQIITLNDSSNSIQKLIEFLDSEIDQHIKDIIYTEKL